MAETIVAGHKPNTYKAYKGLDHSKSDWGILFLDGKGNTQNAKGGKRYADRRNAYRDADKLNHPIKHTLRRRKAIAAEAYFDGYTLVVREDEDDTTGKTVYTLSIKVGDMPPHFTKDFLTVEAAEDYIRDETSFSLYLSWEKVEGE